MTDRDFIYWLAGFIENKGILDYTELEMLRDMVRNIIKGDRNESIK